ncbi:putative prolyl 4-hydroxylase 4 [Drosera capensis]
MKSLSLLATLSFDKILTSHSSHSFHFLEPQKSQKHRTQIPKAAHKPQKHIQETRKTKKSMESQPQAESNPDADAAAADPNPPITGPFFFGLSDEIISVLPSDPFEQLDVARKITSIALSSRVESLESEASELRAAITERDRILEDLNSQVESLDGAAADLADKLAAALQEKEMLVKENTALSETVKKLRRDVSKLEVFRKTLMQSLQEEEDGSLIAEDYYEGFSLFVPDNDSTLPPSAHSSVRSHSSEQGSTFAEDRDADVVRPRISAGLLLASQTSTPRLTPPGSPPASSASGSPSKTPRPGSPRRHSVSFATSRGMVDHSSFLSTDAGSQARARVDGKEFFRQVRSRLSYEQFGAFLANVKDLNSHKQTKDDYSLGTSIEAVSVAIYKLFVHLRAILAFVYEEFLSDGECDHLISLAKMELKRSAVADNDSGKSKLSEDAIVDRIEDKIASWTFLPKENGEDIQVLRYEHGQKFDPHYDYFVDKVNVARGGKSMATVLMYLSDVTRGCETVFPSAEESGRHKSHEDDLSECAKKGIAVKPRKGDALLFFSLYPNATPDTSSLHRGCPVIEGEKWSATKWIYVNDFSKTVVGGPEDGCTDQNKNCATWASLGEYTKNPEYMVGTTDLPGYCRRSCKAVPRSAGDQICEFRVLKLQICDMLDPF